MTKKKVYGIHWEGRNLCQRCAERFYGYSLELYLAVGELQGFKESDRPAYASQGLLCDDCLRWIFPPDRTEAPGSSVDPDPGEHLRLLAPFADFLESLQIDVMNLRNIVVSKS